MKKIIITFLILVAPAYAMSAGGGYHLDKVDINLENKDSLRHGAKLFVNYCMGCHSASFMRYNRLGRDLGLSEELVADNLVFTADFKKNPRGEMSKVGETMDIAMQADDAKKWFGTLPPDLSVIARSRGADWLYTYLRTFYRDESRPFGVNNAVFKDVGMPHVLWELQGVTEPVFEEVEEHGKMIKKLVGVKTVKPGTLSEAEYDNAIRDMVAFMVYLGEPAKLERYTLGVWVLLFLVILFFVSYALKKEYWKDIH